MKKEKLGAVFQSLIGRLQTAGADSTEPRPSTFQSLIGRLQTGLTSEGEARRPSFQSLIGRLQTHHLVTRRVDIVGFNPS